MTYVSLHELCKIGIPDVIHIRPLKETDPLLISLKIINENEQRDKRLTFNYLNHNKIMRKIESDNMQSVEM